MLLLFHPVLHDETGVFKGNDLSEVALLLVESVQVMEVFVVSQAETSIAEKAEAKLCFQGADHERFHDLKKQGIIVIVEINFPPAGIDFHKTERTGCRDKEIVVKYSGTAVSADHLVNEG